MVRIKELIEKLKTFDENLMCYAYEGEVIGLIIVNENREQKGYIMCSEGFYDESDVEPDVY